MKLSIHLVLVPKFFYIWDSFEMNGLNFLKTPVPAPCLSSKESIHCVVCTLSFLSTEHACNFLCFFSAPYIILSRLHYMYELFVDKLFMLRQFPDNAFYGRLVGPLPLRELVLVWALICTDDTAVSSFSLPYDSWVYVCDSLCWFCKQSALRKSTFFALEVLLMGKTKLLMW